MHIDHSRVEFYLKSLKKKKKKGHKLFLNIFTYYMEIVHTPQSQEPFSIFQISSIFFDYGGWVWKNKIKEIYFIFYIKYYKFKSEFIIMLFKILITWHHIT